MLEIKKQSKRHSVRDIYSGFIALLYLHFVTSFVQASNGMSLLSAGINIVVLFLSIWVISYVQVLLFRT